MYWPQPENLPNLDTNKVPQDGVLQLGDLLFFRGAPHTDPHFLRTTELPEVLLSWAVGRVVPPLLRGAYDQRPWRELPACRVRRFHITHESVASLTRPMQRPENFVLPMNVAYRESEQELDIEPAAVYWRLPEILATHCIRDGELLLPRWAIELLYQLRKRGEVRRLPRFSALPLHRVPVARLLGPGGSLSSTFRCAMWAEIHKHADQHMYRGRKPLDGLSGTVEVDAVAETRAAQPRGTQREATHSREGNGDGDGGSGGDGGPLPADSIDTSDAGVSRSPLRRAASRQGASFFPTRTPTIAPAASAAPTAPAPRVRSRFFPPPQLKWTPPPERSPPAAAAYGLSMELAADMVALMQQMNASLRAARRSNDRESSMQALDMLELQLWQLHQLTYLETLHAVGPHGATSLSE